MFLINNLPINSRMNTTHLNFLPTKVQFGFTLAEVLITLGIIGVVAAMTIPNLMTKNQQRETVTKLERAISVFNQAYKMSFDELGDVTPNEALALGAPEYVKKYWAPFIKINSICTTYDQCGYDNINPMTTPNGTNTNSNIISGNARIGITTMDGFTYVIYTAWWDTVDNTGFTKPASRVLVDLNGSAKPNRWGRDVFALERVEDKGVFPAGYDKSNEQVNNSCNKNGNGEFCAEKIRRAGWNIEKDYPW